MIYFNQGFVDRYMQNDWVLKDLLLMESEKDAKFRSQSWLREMENKRMIFPYLYGDLLEDSAQYPKSVIDVGGGFTSFTRKFIQRTDYTLLDFMAHDEHRLLREIEQDCKSHFWINKDWYEFTFDRDYDLVIANDIFPDVDQRLELFIDRFLPHCREFRILLTYYNYPKFYTAKRVDDTEKLTFLSWDGEILGMKLKKYLPRMMDTTERELNEMKYQHESIFRNGRQIALVTMTGDLA